MGTLHSQAEDGNGERWQGYIKAMRGSVVMELIRHNPFAYVLATVIAHRARWRESSFNPNNLSIGEALLGDWKECGMSEQNYRTAKSQLEKWGIATFRPTNKGTIGKLTDTRLFDVLNTDGNDPANREPTGSQRAGNEQVTTNEEGKKRIEKERGAAPQTSRITLIPTEAEVVAQGQIIGLDEVTCRQWFKDRQAEGWCDRNGVDIGNWKAWLTRFRDMCRNRPGQGVTESHGKAKRCAAEAAPPTAATRKPRFITGQIDPTQI